MPVRPIILAPDARLRRKAEPVCHVDNDVRHLMQDMVETMQAASGIGLAATQIGVDRRVIVVISEIDQEVICMADPDIIDCSEETVLAEEGCLSLPGIFAELPRSTRLIVRYRDQDDQTRIFEAESRMAVCLQHEIDHLNGLLFIDHLSRIRRDLLWRRLAKNRRLKR